MGYGGGVQVRRTVGRSLLKLSCHCCEEHRQHRNPETNTELT